MGSSAIFNMFKLGDYEEHEAREISAYLKKVGIKVDLKPIIEAEVQNEEFLEGRFSEIKGEIKYKDKAQEVERYLDALKKVMQEKPSLKDFGEKYLKILFPSIDEDLEAIKKALGSGELGESDVEAGAEGASEGNDAPGSTGAGRGQKGGSEPSQEEIDRQCKSISDLNDLLIKSIKAKDFALSVLSLNDATIGDVIEAKLDDPIVAVSVDLDEYGHDHPKAKSVLSVYLDKSYELYVDEFSTTLAEALDEEFQVDHMEESIKIRSMDLLLGELIENHSSEKMDLADFGNECYFSTEHGKSAYRVFGDTVAEDIARVLEKNGMLKMKGNAIKWKK